MSYVIRRVILLLPTLLIVLTLTFVLLRLAPGDPVALLLEDVASPEAEARLRENLGLDQPLYVQYLKYLGNVFRGDLGTSVRNKLPFMDLLAVAVPNTLALAAASIVLAVLIAIPLGVYAGVRRNTWGDHVVMAFAVVGRSMPHFWLGILLLLFGALWLGWFPSYDPGSGPFWERLRALVLPALALGLSEAPLLARLTRSSILDSLSQDYVRTARAKGQVERIVVYKHALRNALLPVLTVIGLSLARLLGGSIVVEIVFTRMGMGQLLVHSILARDYPMVQGVVVVFAFSVLLVNLVIDLLYAAADPRIKYA